MPENLTLFNIETNEIIKKWTDCYFEVDRDVIKIYKEQVSNKYDYEELFKLKEGMGLRKE